MAHSTHLYCTSLLPPSPHRSFPPPSSPPVPPSVQSPPGLSIEKGSMKGAGRDTTKYVPPTPHAAHTSRPSLTHDPRCLTDVINWCLHGLGCRFFVTCVNYVLCCSCGAKLTENSWDNFVNISIPLSEASQQVTILGHPHLMVQTHRNPADLAFDLVTVRRSGCSGVGEGGSLTLKNLAPVVIVGVKFSEHFFYQIFEPESKASTTHFKASLEGFYGLILEKLVTEKFS
ncbi:hypothetical protein O3P69_016298 [Scylla paramamosain]|uniref:Uncharacterized protein n=1 Tax=Scylla paramamosain TaxID=85552 RepID=A0AAW0SAT3_SCYPA